MERGIGALSLRTAERQAENGLAQRVDGVLNGFPAGRASYNRDPLALGRFGAGKSRD